ncbi:MAG TPA: PKD domain-containing protein, partial [Flavipsychrobacter sp.]|nr:PKD domain-containing protein [Flavipsychrobacter sp.]
MRGFLYTLMCIGIGVGFPILTNAQLTAKFGADNTSGCSPIVVNFTDSSTGSPTSWSWDLGNGATSTLQNPSTTYLTAGTYTVKLTVKSGASSSTLTKTSYITVLASPTVSFTASDSTATCPPKTITFTNSSTAGTGTATYLWDFGDGTSSTAKNPTHTYTTSGKYDVSLIVTNSSGCNKTLTKNGYIDMADIPAASFTSANASACTAPATVSFTNTSTGATSYSWNFGDGSTSTSASPSHSYASTGTYTVKLIATNSSGCSDTLISTDFVNIGNLNASFTTTTPGCSGAPVSFTNTSIPSSATSAWSFGDGTTSTSASPTHTYSSSGTYTVRLIERLSGCADTTSTTITVHPSAVVSFSAASTTSCKTPFSVSFTNSTTGASSYSWSFGDGSTSTTTSPTHSYTADGNYTVKLIATTSFGCKDSLTKSNYINITPPGYTISADPSGGCVGTTVSFTTTATSAALSSYKWTFGDGGTSTTSLSPSHTYSTAGTYKVVFSYTTTGGCTDSATVSITINTKPTASFTDSNSTICPLHIVYFKNTSTGTSTSYTWNFGDGTTSNIKSPNHEYGGAGTFTITLIATNGTCSDTATKVNAVTVYPPSALFSYKIDCSNRLKVTFTNSSLGDSTTSWSFGDGTTSTTFSPTHTYTSYGADTVYLTVTDTKYGCTSTIVHIIHLIPPGISFTASDTTICKGTPITFSPLNPSLYNSFSWNFGVSGATSTNATATYTYTSAGFYSVKLTGIDINGCTDSLTKSRYIEVGGPTPAFSATPVNSCPLSSVGFTDASTDGGIKITNRKWYFGDGVTNIGNNTTPSHTYSSVGTYDVKLVVIDTLGCKDSILKPEYIKVTKPTALFSTIDTTLCPGQTAHFTNNSDSASSYSWSFGDGGTSTASNPSHTYATGGTYTVTLAVKNTNGCTDTLTRTSYIKVNKLTAAFTMDDSTATCPPLSVTFTNTSVAATSYSWTFGNGSTSTLTSPTTVYSKSDKYTIKLVAKNSSGCADSTTDTVSVLGPKGTFSYSASATGCEPLTVTFTATDTNATSLTWDMNNGFTHSTTASSYTYTYTSPGTYVPILVLSDGSKCNVAIQGADTIKVDGIRADFTFSPDSICTPAIIHFVDTADSSLSTVNTRKWSFGDGGTSTLHNPSHTYTTSGSYNVRLIIGNATGCVDTVIKTVYINTPPTVSAGPNQSMCPGTTSVKLVASGASSYSWYPSTGLSCTNCDSTFANPTATTIYSVVGTDVHGCVDTAKVTVTLYPKPNVSTDSSVQICAGNSIKLSASGASSYTWYPGTGLSCTSCDTTTVTTTTTAIYHVIGKNSNGCLDTAGVTVNVNPLPNVVADSTQSICKGTSANLSASGASTYSWSPATGLSCTACADPTASPTTTT